jgi:N,N'-diacetyllegionaminate synthase
MRQVKIGNRFVGDGHPPYVVAEVGINHNGQLEKAFEMINVSKKAGVDAVKFQTFKAEEFVGDPSQTYTYYSQGEQVTESMLEMFKRYEFSKDEWKAIKKKCDEEEILFLSTPQNVSDLELLLELEVPAVKVGSDDFTNLPLLKKYAETRLPIILSCGMSDLGEVYQSLESVGALDGYPTILLLCTSQYPTPPEDVNLKKLETLSNAFRNIPIGFSDHTQGHLASSLAIPFGACFFEKHFTLDNNLPGPDHWFSENPISLKTWVDAIRTSYKMLGSNLVRPTEEEKNMRLLARRYVVALKDIKKGDVFNEINISLRRAGTEGLSPSFFDQIIGKKAIKEIEKGSTLKLGDFE